ncbi:MAG: aldolase [Alphaproteobacteria bacterium]|nr:aldolase [Alphaproteobacteria bacterium]
MGAADSHLPSSFFIHANALALGEAGVLIRGPSGSGKSALTDALLYEARRLNLFGRLVGDDRIQLEARGGRLIASGHREVAGLIERRGQGIVSQDYEKAVVLSLVVDLVENPHDFPRFPSEEERFVALEGVVLPRLPLLAASHLSASAARVLEFLGY